MILVSIWSAKGEGRVSIRKLETIGHKRNLSFVHYERAVLTAIQRCGRILLYDAL